ncbi:MAG: hypothetical protein LBB23_00730 [Rickettsiales bacterium]|jgi:hypothetical protein|nr:hypothetical protein [Rickettsiales bacterium]
MKLNNFIFIAASIFAVFSATNAFALDLSKLDSAVAEKRNSPSQDLNSCIARVVQSDKIVGKKLSEGKEKEIIDKECAKEIAANSAKTTAAPMAQKSQVGEKTTDPEVLKQIKEEKADQQIHAAGKSDAPELKLKTRKVGLDNDAEIARIEKSVSDKPKAPAIAAAPAKSENSIAEIDKEIASLKQDLAKEEKKESQPQRELTEKEKAEVALLTKNFEDATKNKEVNDKNVAAFEKLVNDFEAAMKKYGINLAG